MYTSNSPIICIMGPTASGKTGLAIELVQRLPAAIISVDSAMVYRGMDIGTAKPTPAEQALAPHRLIDICDPAETYSTGQFCQDALREVEAIQAAGQIPILVGGTMLYFHALQHGIADLPNADQALRAELDAKAEVIGWQGMHARLAEVDPAAAVRIHPNDPQRIQRALEVYELTGVALSELQQQTSAPLPAERCLNIVIAPQERATLHARIELRLQQMLEAGLVAEVEGLMQRGDLHADLPSMRSVGYRQVWAYLQDEYDYATMQDRVLVATRQFAKRQYTWLRQWRLQAHWLLSEDEALVTRVIEIIEGAQDGDHYRY